MLRSEAAEIAGFGVRQQYPACRSLTVQSATIAYLLPDELRCQLCLEKAQARLSLKATRQFLKRDGFPAYEVKIVLARNSPIGPALAYRDLLIKAGRHAPFAEKVKQTLSPYRNRETSSRARTEHISETTSAGGRS